ncbi:unnamed protein product [Brassica oleracea var. botrytis]
MRTGTRLLSKLYYNPYISRHLRHGYSITAILHHQRRHRQYHDDPPPFNSWQSKSELADETLLFLMMSSCMPLDFNHNSAAKILVEVELSKGFPSSIAANDENVFISMVDVDYAWLPSKCERCGKLRHKIKHCLESVTKSHIVATDVSENPSNGSTVVVKTNKLPKSAQPDTSLVQTSAVTVFPPSNESSVVDIAILENQLCGTLSAIPVFMSVTFLVDCVCL